MYQLALWVRAYPWILSKYLCVCVFVSFVPLQIILGTVFRLRICILVVESLCYLVEMLNIMQPHVFPMYVTFLRTFDTDSYINCWHFFLVVGSCVCRILGLYHVLVYVCRLYWFQLPTIFLLVSNSSRVCRILGLYHVLMYVCRLSWFYCLQFFCLDQIPTYVGIIFQNGRICL